VEAAAVVEEVAYWLEYYQQPCPPFALETQFVHLCLRLLALLYHQNLRQ
tara:strand:- start:920 stop:1066 length:147 start_codon:yes stop_codon:yes gene_type:complete